MIKTLNQIKGSSMRMVFLDEGHSSPDSYAVYSGVAIWYDLPMITHGQGTDVSYADGHAGRIMWKEAETIACGQLNGNTYNVTTCTPTTCAGKEDLYEIQAGCWGTNGLSYTLDTTCQYAPTE